MLLPLMEKEASRGSSTHSLCPGEQDRRFGSNDCWGASTLPRSSQPGHRLSPFLTVTGRREGESHSHGTGSRAFSRTSPPTPSAPVLTGVKLTAHCLSKGTISSPRERARDAQKDHHLSASPFREPGLQDSLQASCPLSRVPSQELRGARPGVEAPQRLQVHLCSSQAVCRRLVTVSKAIGWARLS